MLYNALLLVKDFGATGELTTDMTFMTNADVPTLAVEGLIADPVNPFTGHPINSDDKNAPALPIFGSESYSVKENNGNTFVPGVWVSVHDNIFDLDNWTYLGEY